MQSVSQTSDRRSPRRSEAVDPAIYERRWKILGVLALSLLIIGLDNTVLNGRASLTRRTSSWRFAR